MVSKLHCNRQKTKLKNIELLLLIQKLRELIILNLERRNMNNLKILPLYFYFFNEDHNNLDRRKRYYQRHGQSEGEFLSKDWFSKMFLW